MKNQARINEVRADFEILAIDLQEILNRINELTKYGLEPVTTTEQLYQFITAPKEAEKRLKIAAAEQGQPAGKLKFSAEKMAEFIELPPEITDLLKAAPEILRDHPQFYNVKDFGKIEKGRFVLDALKFSEFENRQTINPPNKKRAELLQKLQKFEAIVNDLTESGIDLISILHPTRQLINTDNRRAWLNFDFVKSFVEK